MIPVHTQEVMVDLPQSCKTPKKKSNGFMVSPPMTLQLQEERLCWADIETDDDEKDDCGEFWNSGAMIMPWGGMSDGSERVQPVDWAKAHHHEERKELDDRQSLWQRRGQQRLRQIQIGKSTPEYCKYLQHVKPACRTMSQPSTPDPYEKVSKRNFDKALSAWRRRLHEFDESSSDVSTAVSSSSSAGACLCKDQSCCLLLKTLSLAPNTTSTYQPGSVWSL
eukprot:gnl/MRDRNA2_/MRDRNA2_71283_c0_seq1.p1 gnl/MRDRNA2_/MRDRNA2_71283_c0~~gnl/MRDRNA2_/MRDRNA2_71283_c0_seq1.p1  ORF type:complete len:222 (-),score=45.60 gnl/MRDRNA2_/MRDRNA2_71283_c0_seq1:216-881(-)